LARSLGILAASGHVLVVRRKVTDADGVESASICGHSSSAARICRRAARHARATAPRFGASRYLAACARAAVLHHPRSLCSVPSVSRHTRSLQVTGRSPTRPAATSPDPDRQISAHIITRCMAHPPRTFEVAFGFAVTRIELATWHCGGGQTSAGKPDFDRVRGPAVADLFPGWHGICNTRNYTYSIESSICKSVRWPAQSVPIHIGGSRYGRGQKHVR
jgi:hypothetical protein